MVDNDNSVHLLEILRPEAGFAAVDVENGAVLIARIVASL